MFNFVQWDSPLTLVMELALSLAVVAGIMFVARVVNARSASPPHGGGDAASEPSKKDE